MILALEDNRTPPNSNFEVPNPRKSQYLCGRHSLDVLGANLVLPSGSPVWRSKPEGPVEVMPWPQGRVERVGVDGFGIEAPTHT
jgi:hypothetical protein